MRLGGSERRPPTPCAPTSFLSACASVGSPPTKRRSLVSVWFANGCATRAKGWLLIFDNAPDAAKPAELICRPHGAARAAGWDFDRPTPGERVAGSRGESAVWPRQVGAGYLIARTGRVKERAEAEALSEALGGLTLAHEQAAAYCERLGVSLSDYRMRFEAAPARLLDTVRDASADYHGGLTVAKSVALAIDEAAKQHPAAEPLIAYAALLAPEPIPLFLFSEGCERFGEPLASDLAGDGLDEAVAALRAFALVDRDTIADERDPSVTTETIRLHRLVRIAAAARRQAAEAEAGRRGLIEAIARVYPPTVSEDPNAWPRARRLDALALDLVVGPDLPPACAEAAAHLLTVLGMYRGKVLAAYAVARPLYERALAIREKVLGPEHPNIAASLNNLAFSGPRATSPARGRSTSERCDQRKTLGAEHPGTGEDPQQPRRLLEAQEDPAGRRGRSTSGRCDQREGARGPEHPTTATSLNNLAGLLRTGRPSRRAAAPQRALVIRETALGPSIPRPPRIASRTVSQPRHEPGRPFARARPLHERALAVYERRSAPSIPIPARLLRPGTGASGPGRPRAARGALPARTAIEPTRCIGPDHPEVARDLD